MNSMIIYSLITIAWAVCGTIVFRKLYYNTNKKYKPFLALLSGPYIWFTFMLTFMYVAILRLNEFRKLNKARKKAKEKAKEVTARFK